MFETSRPQSSRRALPLLFLPLSLGFHAVIAIVVLIASLWDVVFPSHSPMVAVAFQLAQPPPPPPPLPPRAARVTAVRAVVRPAKIVAPTIIPDTIVPVEEEPSVPPPPGAVEGGDPNGVEGGEIGGVEGGVIGGVITEEKPKPAPVVEDRRLHVERDVPLPPDMRELFKPYPDYPARAILRAIEDQLIVRYVIGKNGRVQDVMVIQNPQHQMFVRPTLAAIRSWRFSALVRDGERQEVVHEVTVYFRLRRESVASSSR